MNKSYLLATDPTNGIAATVFATGVESPIEALDELERELAARRVVGKVLFDVLLSQGTRANRYFVGEFDGSRFSKSQIKPLTKEYRTYSALSARFLRDHYSEIDPVLLTNAMRFALRTGHDF